MYTCLLIINNTLINYDNLILINSKKIQKLVISKEIISVKSSKIQNLLLLVSQKISN